MYICLYLDDYEQWEDKNVEQSGSGLFRFGLLFQHLSRETEEKLANLKVADMPGEMQTLFLPSDS
jgi:hypothetical protein